MKRTHLLLSLLTLVLATPSFAQVPASGTVRRPIDAGKGTVIVPDRFLRSWDAVTIFFDRPVGRKAGTAEDHPERFVTMEPRHPGALTWIDASTLQFRPADAWSPLERFTWKIAGKSSTLHTLMSPPVRTLPEDGATGLGPVEAITLSFSDPLDTEDLARMVTIELLPLPGLDDGKTATVWLTREDFEVKAVDRKSRDDMATFVLALETPIPMGTRAIVHLRLSLDDDSSRSFTEFSFATLEPFRVTTVGSRSTRFPLTPSGSRYTADQAINGGSDARTVVVEFSAPPRTVGPVQGRNLVRISPAVEKLVYRSRGRTLEIDGDFDWDKLYRVTIVPPRSTRGDGSLTDQRGRPLELRGANELYIFFPRRPTYLKWLASEGVLERFGPKMVPVEGRGHDRFDLRVYPVDPLDRSFWPFPPQPIGVDEAQRPPGPGEVPKPFTEARFIREQELHAQLTALGSPPVSSLVRLPLRKEGGAASFGLDLAPHLERLAPPRAPGHYLVGLRPLDASSQRQWMRVQVTDLSLTTSEYAGKTRLVVTSISTARPIGGAAISVEGSKRQGSSNGWAVLASGITDQDGAFEMSPLCNCECKAFRISVKLGVDVLVIDSTRPPDNFADNHWSSSGPAWLHCGSNPPGPALVSHVFTERPVYRPDEAVHVKGYVRKRHQGELGHLGLSSTFVVVEGPGDLVWRYPVGMSATGSFYQEFLEPDRPTGTYRAYLEGRHRSNAFRSRTVTFTLEAYRIPRFEVHLHAPEKVPLDSDFEVALTATYYAGGRVADRPVRFKVTQFPYTWRTSGRDGFLFSSDARFSNQRFDTNAALDKEDRTDEAGSATLVLDPSSEPTAQPRTYVVEATVTGADDQTVTANRRIVALPPFVLGLKVPRYIEKATAIEPEVLVLDGDGEGLAGHAVTVRLLHRQWHSYLRASDFSDGEARYITNVVDEKISETTVTSAEEALALNLPISEAGVYVVEIEARDRVGRTQTVAVDLYAGGDTPVSWSRPTTPVFAVKTDKASYDPGESAVFVLESPFQRAEVLVIVEAPEGNRYSWLPVRGGSATYRLPVQNTWVPRLPIHFVLMRGRAEGSGPLPGTSTDLGKPVTLASTSWITINPRDNRVEVELDYPPKALPGQTVDVTVRLRDPGGAPLPGEVTLWLVDQAVLALGQEQRLDPLPDFITAVKSRLRVRDTRGLPFGELPFAENPGGGEGEKSSILDNATVRRNFKPVPFYEPAIAVDASGVRTVRVQLPDNLTNFKLRAKATSGFDRFGFGKGHLEVRLPLIIQPALPRFVRPGDTFLGAAIGRVVEGEGGPGAAEIQLEGVTLDGESRHEITWIPNRPHRVDFPVSVPTPQYDDEGQLSTKEAVFRVGVERESDGATDAFEVKIPIRDDRRVIVRRGIFELGATTDVEIPPVEGEARPGTVLREVLVSSQPALVKMAAGLNFLRDYPYGCTEQRMSRARAYIAMEKFRDTLQMQGSDGEYKRTVNDTITWIGDAIDSRGLVSYWPGAQGYVSLTAWTLQFLVEAREAGFTVGDDLMATVIDSLEQAMRSDYRFFIDGASFAERAWSLTALTRAGRFSPSYAAELARQAQFLDLESTAHVLQAFILTGGQSGRPPHSSQGDALAEKLWNGVVIRLYQGNERYGGLQRGDTSPHGLILPSETRSVAEMVRALARYQPDHPRVQVLIDGLVTLGRGDGWGSTNSNSAALFALVEVLTSPSSSTTERSFAMTIGDEERTFQLTSESPLVHVKSSKAGDGKVVLLDGDAELPPLVVRAETRFIPAADGSTVEAESRGFVVTRELLHVVPDVPPRRFPFEAAGQVFDLTVGDVIEDHVQVINPSDRYYVAVVVPLAAGMEPLNPNLATAPPEARPAGSLTMAPSYAMYLDDKVAFFYDALPKGTYDFYFRVRANLPGNFIQPSALTEMMYDGSVRGSSHGARVKIVAAEGEMEWVRLF